MFQGSFTNETKLKQHVSKFSWDLHIGFKPILPIKDSIHQSSLSHQRLEAAWKKSIEKDIN